MEKIKWEQRYSSGLIYLDNHRRNFIGIIQELQTTIEEGSCEQMLPMIFHRMAFYIEDYFLKKEMALQDADYLPLSKYKVEHDRFTTQMVVYQERFLGGEEGLCREMVDFLINWFENYITLFDQEGVAFLRSKGYE